MIKCNHCKQGLLVNERTYKKLKNNGSIFYVPRRIASEVMDIVHWHFEKGTHVICTHCQTLITLNNGK